MPGRTEEEALFLDIGPCCRWISSRLLLCCQAVAIFSHFFWVAQDRPGHAHSCQTCVSHGSPVWGIHYSVAVTFVLDIFF